MSPRTESNNQKIREERREQILYSALKIFAARGLKATKISEIAGEAKISQGLVHHYFPNKQDVFVAVVERAMTGALAVYDEAIGRSASPWARLETLTNRMLDGLERHPEYLLVVIQCLMSADTPPQSGKMIAEYGHSLFIRLEALVREGQEAGEITAGDSVELSLAFISMIQGLVITQFTQGLFTLRPDATVEFAMPSSATILRLLKA